MKLCPIFINRYFHPDHSLTSQMQSDLAFGLNASGHNVGIAASDRHYDSPGERLACARDPIGKVEVFRAWTSRLGA